MRLRPVRLCWHPASQKPDKPGVYLIWSRRLGARVCDTHPSWWNYRDRKRGRAFHGPRVTRWAYLWPIGYMKDTDNGGEQP
jgi:hypothetical protein